MFPRRRGSQRVRQKNKPKQNWNQVEVVDLCHSDSTTEQNRSQVEVVDLSSSDSTTEVNMNQNLTVNIQKVEEVPEVEIEASNDSNQFEVASIPFERVLSNDIQASNDFGGTSKENHSKSVSAGSSCPSFSFNLTEMVNMWNGEDDEVDCAEQSDDTIGGYKLKPEYMPILREILSKYGDIARNCTLTMKHRSMLLEMICEIISELREKDLVKIKEDDLKNMIDLVNDIKNREVDIEWLHQRLVKLLETRQVVDQSAAMKEGKEINKKFIKIAERRLEECEKKKKELGAQLRSLCDKETETKERLARALDESTKIKEAIKQAKDKVRCFLRHSMADGLI